MRNGQYFEHAEEALDAHSDGVRRGGAREGGGGGERRGGGGGGGGGRQRGGAGGREFGRRGGLAVALFAPREREAAEQARGAPLLRRGRGASASASGSRGRRGAGAARGARLQSGRPGERGGGERRRGQSDRVASARAALRGARGLHRWKPVLHQLAAAGQA